ncbi:chemotaxis protein CheW [Massilia sp. TS11]|uniref:chemotaxis protein CheW n=1 Tax=Massilia sp. TS11 TaxID=2908003 RepID=UPI001EDB2BD7|nr:chemotaxis protein CheW [Massilia sp. TS11]MCG2585451.1 chemotaxis protein CheW [Massilia sp. TS11]
MALLDYARVELGGVQFALPASQVRRAMTRPQDISPLPQAHRSVDGVFRGRGQGELVPVVDLRRWMDPPLPSTSTPRRVLLVSDGAHCVGLAVDAIHGILRVDEAAVTQIVHGGAREQLFHSVATPPEPDAAPIGLLDTAQLLALVPVWAPDSGRSAATTSARTRVDEAPYAIVRSGSRLLAIAATDVGQVLPMPELPALFWFQSHVLGMARWRQRDLPVLDLAHLDPGLDGVAGRAGRLLLVLDRAQQAAGIPIDEVIAVRRLRADRLQARGPQDPELAAGAFLLDSGEHVQLLESAGVLGACPSSALAEAKPHTARASASAHVAHVVFRADGDWAAPLEKLEAIAPLPPLLQESEVAYGQIGASCEWRGQTLPLIDLRGPARGAGRLMVLRGTAKPVGVAVEEVVALLPGHLIAAHSFNFAGGDLIKMLSARQDGVTRSYRLMEFERLLGVAQLAWMGGGFGGGMF